KGRYVDDLEISPLNDLPVIDYGRIYVPEVQIENNTFDASLFAPWENVGEDGKDWEEDTSTGRIYVELFAGAPFNVSKDLQTRYRFYVGKTYRIILSFTVVESTTDGQLSLILKTTPEDVNAINLVDTIPIT